VYVNLRPDWRWTVFGLCVPSALQAGRHAHVAVASQYAGESAMDRIEERIAEARHARMKERKEQLAT
jgi:hypothetical protein